MARSPDRLGTDTKKLARRNLRASFFLRERLLGRLFRNGHRLNCVLQLMTFHLRGEAGVPSWARALRENHLRHDDKPPPQLAHDGERI